MALIDNKFRRRLHCDKKECAQNLKQSIKVYDYLKTSTMGVVKAKASKADRTLRDDVKKSVRVVPGELKMAAVSTMIAVLLWTSLQLGSHFGPSSQEVQAFSMLRLPVSLQSFVGWYSPRRHGSGGDHRQSLMELRDINEKIDQAVNSAFTSVDRLSRLEENLKNSGVNVREGTPMHGQLISSYPSDNALRHGKDAHLAIKASMHLSHSVCYEHGLNHDECARFLTMHKLPTSSEGRETGEQSNFLGDKCAALHGASLVCSETSKYRSANGSCNHLTHPSWGQSLTGYRRLLFPLYSDGIQEPRIYAIGKPKNKHHLLPSPRTISTQVIRNAGIPDSVKTLALMQWTQFVEHDLAHTPITKMYNNFESSIVCCDNSGFVLAPRHRHPACLPIDIPQSDPFYSKKYMNCMNYVRSVTAMRPDCSFGPAEQMNQASHYLDGSMIYGSTEEKARSLRSFQHGRLRFEEKQSSTFLPSSPEPSKHCQLSSDSQACYESGDLRVNGHPHLSVMHTVWLREHNRIADKLETLNPDWNDETLYQEARKIVIAEIQHITYSEWLPLVVGDRYLKKIGLTVKSSGFSSEYSENVDPSITNSFATAALRFVHSLMEGNLSLMSEDREVNHTLRLMDHFNKPRVLEENGHFDSLVRGLATQNSQKSDLTFTTDITNMLYRDRENYGLDIISLDIQRGRDHGLPGYNSFRKMCGLPPATNFRDLESEIPSTMVEKLERMYSNVDDVDLLIGGMAENHKDDGLLGPTFRCIFAEQFSRTRKGDRFFYDLNNQQSSFSADQLQEIRKVSLARIFCDNTDVSQMQRNIFHKPSESNSLVSCQDATNIPKVDLTAWSDSE